MRRVFSAAVVGAAAVALAGCGGGAKFVPVSGTVTLDGQPYKNAVVSFQPVASAGNQNPGVGSSALTDEQGRFTLVAIDGQSGAVVGKHRVRIQTKRDAGVSAIDPNIGSDDSTPADARKKGMVDPIPVEWYGDAGNKEFDVPAGGTDKANFDIVSARGAKKK